MKLPYNVTSDDVEKFISITKTVLETIENSTEDIAGRLHEEHLEEMVIFVAKWEGRCMSDKWEFGKSEGIPSKNYD